MRPLERRRKLTCEFAACFDIDAREAEFGAVPAASSARARSLAGGSMVLFCCAVMLGVACASGASAQAAPGAPPGARPPPEVVAPAVPIDLAVEAARAAVASCAGFRVGVTILDQLGFVKLAYLPDGVGGSHTHTAERKAITALLLKAPSEGLKARMASDKAIADKVAAATTDTYMPVAGGLPIVANGEVIGSIGVSGAMPATKDKSCATDGIAAIQARLR